MTGDEVVANVLHVLSRRAAASASPLLCRFEPRNNGGALMATVAGEEDEEEEEEGGRINPDVVVSWDPDGDGGGDAVGASPALPTTSLSTFLQWNRMTTVDDDPSSRTPRRLGRCEDDSMMMRVTKIERALEEGDDCHLDGPSKGGGGGYAGGPSDGDDLLWRAGLNLLRKYASPPCHEEESAAAPEDDGGNDGSRGSRRAAKKNSIIPPHELLRTIMDSYYYRSDDDDEDDDGREAGEPGEFVGVAAPASASASASAGAVVGAASPSSLDPSSRRIMYTALPSSLALFALRSLLLSRALEGASESISRPVPCPKLDPSSSLSSAGGTAAPVVRWRRLGSMADDAISLFRKMSLDHLGDAIENFGDVSWQPRSSGTLPVEIPRVVRMAAWAYANRVFPSCRDLLHRILRKATTEGNVNGSGSGNGKGTPPSRVRTTLRTCHESFGMLTSLLALDVVVVAASDVGVRRASSPPLPPSSVRWMLELVESRRTDDLFDLARLSTHRREFDVEGRNEADGRRRQRHVAATGEGDDSDGEDDATSSHCHLSWVDDNDGFVCANGGGSSLEEDLLLRPGIRRMSHCESADKDGQGGGGVAASFYDEMGIALMASWRLRGEAGPKNGADPSLSTGLRPLPYPYSGQYRWTLLFPHVVTLLRGSRASSTVRRMEELELFSGSGDDYLVRVDLAAISLGFDMLHALITRTPFIRPESSSRFLASFRNPVVQWAHSARALEPAIAALFSHVARMSPFEAQRRGKKPTSGENDDPFPLKYSSSEVMRMARDLLRFYRPETQAIVLLGSCRRMMATQDRALLPRVLDMVRPLMTGTWNRIQLYSDGAIALEDMKVVETVSEVIDIFLAECKKDLGDSTTASPLPGNFEEFMSLGEAYSSVFAIVRLQRIWISRCRAVEEEMAGNWDALKYFRRIANWMDGCLGKLKSLDLSLSRLIDFVQSSDEDDRPNNWHRVFLVKLALEDSLTQP